jgi:hypothetical protein
MQRKYEAASDALPNQKFNPVSGFNGTSKPMTLTSAVAGERIRLIESMRPCDASQPCLEKRRPSLN